MRRIRIAAAGLLVLAGLVEMLELAGPGAGGNAVITALFGLAHLATGILLFRGTGLVLYAGIAVPLAFTLLMLASLVIQPNPQAGFYIAADLVIAACCAYLVYRGQAQAG